MEPSEKAYQMIRDWEKFSPRATKAIKEEKYYTIGYGHYGPDVDKHKFITVQQAEELLHKDVETYSGKLASECPYLQQHQYDALISLIYNIGWYNFRHSTTFLYMKLIGLNYSPEECAARIVLWVRAAGKVLLGLQRRRVAEANYFLGREYYKIENSEITHI
mgnify:CR=1 FL=1